MWVSLKVNLASSLLVRLLERQLLDSVPSDEFHAAILNRLDSIKAFMSKEALLKEEVKFRVVQAWQGIGWDNGCHLTFPLSLFIPPFFQEYNSHCIDA